MEPFLVLDLSRLLWRAHRLAPTGIERVELAYARHLLTLDPARVAFSAEFYGQVGLLGRQAAEDLIRACARSWVEARPGDAERISAQAKRLVYKSLFRGEARLFRHLKRAGRPVAHLLVSHHHLDRPKPIQRMKEQTGARFVCFIHDVLPVKFPEYVRPGHDQRHQTRMANAARLADAVVVNSQVTADDFQPFLDRARNKARTLVAHLGVEHRRPAAVAPPAEAAPPYFVCVGTIEPRKNHLLLLNLWRSLYEELGEAAPRLVLVGHRGWENDSVIAMLERSPFARKLVSELGAVSDATLTTLLLGARAALFASFGEGYGLPCAEALTLGVPVICSDLPVLREIYGEMPDYLDPLDGQGWRRTVLDYAAPGSARRAAQIERLAHWQPAEWSSHFTAVDALLSELAR